MKKSLKQMVTTGVLAVAGQFATAHAAVLPESKAYGATTYLSAGWTGEQADAMKEIAPAFNLRLVFAAKTGQYLADIPVTIRNAHGEVLLDGVSEGPLLWAKVPPGRYTVVAEYHGKAQQRTVSLGSRGGSQVYLYWDAPLIDTELE